jgi:hypothetical protein
MLPRNAIFTAHGTCTFLPGPVIEKSTEMPRRISGTADDLDNQS